MNNQIKQNALETFRSNGGILKFSEAIKNGIYHRVLKELINDNLIEKCERGLYVLKDFIDIDQPDLAIISKKIPEGVICFLSALYFHQLTVQIPKQIDVALEQPCKPKKIKHPPIKFHWFTKKFYDLGIESHIVNQIEVKVYSSEKTIVDCFRSPKKVPLSVSIEALKIAYFENKLDLNKLVKFAEAARVLNTIKPYLEMITHEQS